MIILYDFTALPNVTKGTVSCKVQYRMQSVEILQREEHSIENTDDKTRPSASSTESKNGQVTGGYLVLCGRSTLVYFTCICANTISAAAASSRKLYDLLMFGYIRPAPVVAPPAAVFAFGSN